LFFYGEGVIIVAEEKKDEIGNGREKSVRGYSRRSKVCRVVESRKTQTRSEYEGKGDRNRRNRQYFLKKNGRKSVDEEHRIRLDGYSEKKTRKNKSAGRSK